MLASARNWIHRPTRPRRTPKPARKPRLRLDALETRTTPAVIDMLAHPSSATVNGALYTHVHGASGTGGAGLDTFLSMNSNHEVEEGFNTNAPLELDTKEPTRARLLSSIPTVTVGGVVYREFALDINESNNAGHETVILNDLRVYTAGVPNLSGYNPVTHTLGGRAPLYDLDAGGDNSFLLDGSGSGSTDMFFLVPNSVFAGMTPATTYVYLYSRFGDTTGLTAADLPPGFEPSWFAADDGDEHWYAARNGVPFYPRADLLVAKTDGQTTVIPGQTVTYTITVTNAGPTPLTSFQFTDVVPPQLLTPTFGTPSEGTLNLTYDPATRTFSGTWAGVTLGPGESITVSLTGMVDPLAPAGSMTNTVTVDPGPWATDSNLANNTASDTDTITNPSLNVEKAAVVPGGTADTAGELISYTIRVQNTGNMTLTGVTVVDPFVGTLSRAPDAPGDGDNLLEVGETWVFTGTHMVTQAEIDLGNPIVNIVTADSDQTGPDTDDATILVDHNPMFNLQKTATVPGGTADVAGEVITYILTLQNTGNHTLTGVQVSDPFILDLIQTADLVGDNDNLLEVGETWAYAGTHTVTQAEIDAGLPIVNTATATSNETEPDTDEASIPVGQGPALDIEKVAVVPGGTADAAGELIDYTIRVHNTGNVTLTGVTVVDPFVGTLSRAPDAPGDGDNLLEVGETWVFTGTHTVTQVEIDSNGDGDGFLENTATAVSDQTGPAAATASIPVEHNPAFNVLKEATVPGGTANVAGELISYTIRVQNIGNHTLTGVAVSDPFVGTLTRVGDAPGDNDGLLEVGETWVFTGTHTVTQAELDAGVPIVNIATATSNETPSDSDDAIIPVAPTADLAVRKTANVAVAVRGRSLTYILRVTNNGPGTVTSFWLRDTFPPSAYFTPLTFTPSRGSYDPVSGEWTGATLTPGQSVVLRVRGMVGRTVPVRRLFNEVDVGLPQGVTDSNLANNHASLQLPLLVPSKRSFLSSSFR